MTASTQQPIDLPGTPEQVFAALSQLAPQRYPAWLDSAAVGTPQGRWSILMAAPDEQLCLWADGQVTGPYAGRTFLDSLDAWWRVERTTGICGETAPFTGGWLLYLGYELASEIEPTLKLPPAEDPVVACARRMRAALVHDHATGRSWLVCEPDASAAAEVLRADLASIGATPEVAPLSAAVDEAPPAEYLAACSAALEHIAAGNVYQANLARTWHAHSTVPIDPVALYQQLRVANPGPFAALARLPGFDVLSSSPERLVSVRGRRIATRPIAGTRRRQPGDDAAMRAELLASRKERAEHIMLVDLERNDLGRLCTAGSVVVDELLGIESYAHVHHLVSNVSGELLPSVTPGATIRALFPGGTITGCPKVRCMQLIGELERTPRGAYTGSLGYLDRSGDLDLNILIRTLTVRGTQLEFRAGAGIVADSVPARELDETRAKARGLLRALGVAA